MTTKLERIGPIEGGLTLMGDPKKMLDQAKQVCDVLMKVVEEQELFQQIGKRRHMLVEAWEILAHFYGISGKIVPGSVESMVDDITGASGFKATAEAILINTGQVISSAQGMCLNNEDNWNMRPKYEYENGKRVEVGQVRVPSYQLASMAQTRALGKVLSNVLRFVPALAGYSGTPAELMSGDEQDQRTADDRPKGKDPERKSNGGPKKITDPQRKRIFAIAHEVSCPMNTVAQIIQSFGFDIAANVTQEKYDAVVQAVRNWQARPSSGGQAAAVGRAEN